jgi:hypothetical protein
MGCLCVWASARGCWRWRGRARRRVWQGGCGWGGRRCFRKCGWLPPGCWGGCVCATRCVPSRGRWWKRCMGAGCGRLCLPGTGPRRLFSCSRTLAVQEVRAELKPEEKLGYIVELSRSGKHAAMIGDGINDAPSLAAAHVGVAMGARGADAALEQADLVLMHDRLENFLRAYDLSVAARRIIRQNVAVSLGVIGRAGGVCAGRPDSADLGGAGARGEHAAGCAQQPASSGGRGVPCRDPGAKRG